MDTSENTSVNFGGDGLRSDENAQIKKNILNAFYEEDAYLFIKISRKSEILFLCSNYALKLGYNVSEIIGRNYMDFIHEDDIPVYKRHLSILEKNSGNIKLTKRIDLRIKCKNGYYRWFSTCFVFLKENMEFAGLVYDITDYKTENEEYKRFFSLSLDLLCINDINGNFLKLSNSWQDTLGYSPEFMEGKKYIDFIHPDDKKYSEKVLKDLQSGEESIYFANRYRCSDGNYRHFEWKSKLFNNHIYSSCRDITSKKILEEKLLHSRELMKTIIEHSRGSVAVLDKNLRYLYVSQSYIKKHNIKDSNIIGRHYNDVFPDLSEKWKFVYERVLKGEIISNDEDSFINSDGAKEWSQWECRPWYGLKGEIGGVIIYSKIITGQKKMEEMLFNEREQLRTTLMSVGDAVISADVNGTILFINKVAEKLTEWKSEEAVGKNIYDVLNIETEETKTRYKQKVKSVMNTKVPLISSGSSTLISRNHKKIPIEDNVSPIEDINGKVIGVVIVFSDFTEKKQRQEEIEYLSYHDYLTGLYNRRYMEEKIKDFSNSVYLPFSFLVLDVNGLKLVNDAFGHDKGDQLLKAVARIMKTCARKSDVVCRLGGDEFAMLLPNTDTSEAEKIKQKIIKKASVTKSTFVISVAIGYSTRNSEKQEIRDIFIQADNNMYKNKLHCGKTMRMKTIEIVLRQVYRRSKREENHNQRVSEYCEQIASAMNISEDEIKSARLAGILHDIGKIMVPSNILNKLDRLTEKEWEEVKKHPVTSYQILKSIDEYTYLAESVLYHHERFDGKGYPEGLKGDSIPLLSKIIAVADAYESMTSDRNYKERKSKQEAIDELIYNKGTQFDPEITGIFINKILNQENN